MSRTSAVHTLWFAPRHACGGASVAMEDFEVLTMALSALLWRRCNGMIRLHADASAAEFCNAHGLLELWDGGITSVAFERGVPDIDPVQFWAAGKILALAHESAPCALVDTDLIVWEHLCELDSRPNLVVAHLEASDRYPYVAPGTLQKPRGYSVDSEWSWRQPACNTAFAYFGSDDLRRLYTSESLRFMHGNWPQASDTVTHMVFAEQRLLGECAAKLGSAVGCLLPEDQDIRERQRRITHLWGTKQRLRCDEAARRRYCLRCVRRLLVEFPATRALLGDIPFLTPYVDAVERASTCRVL